MQTMIHGFHHTGLVVNDLDQMVHFYTQELGLQLLKEIDSIAPPEGDHTGFPAARRKLVFVGFDNDHQIELVKYIDPPSEDAHFDRHELGALHICFRVSELAALHARLQAKGVRFVTDPKFKDLDGKTVGVVYARDPEGNWLEFIEVL